MTQTSASPVFCRWICPHVRLMQLHSQVAVPSNSSLNEGLVRSQQPDASQNFGMPAPQQCVPFNPCTLAMYETFSIANLVSHASGTPLCTSQRMSRPLLHPTLEEPRPLHPFLLLLQQRWMLNSCDFRICFLIQFCLFFWALHHSTSLFASHPNSVPIRFPNSAAELNSCPNLSIFSFSELFVLQRLLCIPVNSSSFYVSVFSIISSRLNRITIAQLKFKFYFEAAAWTASARTWNETNHVEDRPKLWNAKWGKCGWSNDFQMRQSLS
jgi:hypothetical protein